MSITFVQEGNPNDFPFDTVTVIDPSPGIYGPEFPDTRISRLTDIAGSFEDRLKITPAFALIGGVRLEALTLDRSGSNFDGTVPDGLPFSKTWTPVSYRAAYTYEPIHNLMFYSMYATAYNPAVAGVFSLTPSELQLTSTRLYETGAKQQLWDGRAEWTVALYDIVQRNVFVPVNTTTFDLAGEVASKGLEVSAAISPFEGWKFWANSAWTHARFVNFDQWSGNTPPDVAPIIVNAGASYRFLHWRWPTEIGASVRHVGPRFVFPGQSNDNGCLYDRRRLCVRRHSGPGLGIAGTQNRPGDVSRAQLDQRHLRTMGRSCVSEVVNDSGRGMPNATGVVS